tara:strand:+ start:774 stop:1508 length:735 start_codon:yes stop_codon:yes gene_type:complete
MSSVDVNTKDTLGHNMAEQVLRVKFKPGTTMDQRFKVVVEYLRRLIEDGLRDRYVRQKALQIIHAAGVRQHDELGEITAITKWVQNNVHYVKDPWAVEYFMTARRILKDVEAGNSGADCDDFVIVWASLLGALGYQTGAIIVDSNKDGVFNHVMGCVKTMAPTKKYGNKWIVAELIFPNFKLNQSVPVSKVYPLIADANTARSPIHHQNIAGGINSLSGVSSGNLGTGYQHPYSKVLGFIKGRR